MIDTEEILNKFKLFWQYPVITEKTFYLQNKDNCDFLGFPWATIFDKKYNLQVIFNILKQYIEILESATDNLIKTHKHWIYACDVCWHSLQKSGESYYFKQRIGKQRASFSNISNRFESNNS